MNGSTRFLQAEDGPPLTIGFAAETVRPNFAGGVEHFAYGLLRGLSDLPDPFRLTLTVAKGTSASWRSAIPADERRQIAEVLSTTLLPRNASLTGKALNVARTFKQRSRVGLKLASATRRRLEAMSVGSRDVDVTYYPHHLTAGYRVPSVITAHDLRDLQPHLRQPQALKAHRDPLARAAAVVTSWPHPLSQIGATFPDLHERLFLTAFPVLFSPGNTAGIAQSVLPPYVLYPASTAEHKNHANLVRAWSILRDSGIHLVCTGGLSSPWYDRAVELARELSVSDRIEFTGFVSDPDLDALYRGALAIVVPSMWEAASGPVYEAFAYGRPVACSRIAPIVSQVDMVGACVEYFDPAVPSDIARAVLQVVRTPEPYVQGSRDAASILSRLTWAGTARRYFDIWQWVAKGSPTSERPPLLDARLPHETA